MSERKGIEFVDKSACNGTDGWEPPAIWPRALCYLLLGAVIAGCFFWVVAA